MSIRIIFKPSRVHQNNHSSLSEHHKKKHLKSNKILVEARVQQALIQNNI